MASLDELLYEIRRIEENRVTLTEKKIKSIYRSLNKDLSAFIAEEYVKYADKDGKLFLSYLDSKNKRAKFLSEIVKNVDSISPDVKKEILDMVDKTYEKTYKGIAKAVKNADDTKELLSGTNTLVRPEVLKRAVNNNIEKLTLDAVMEKHRAEIIADIQQTLNVGLMNGDRYETMAKRIQERLGVSYSKATNITRTESHRNIESGFMDGAKETSKIIDKDGNLIYAATWRTMQDERVRPQQRRRKGGRWITTMSNNGANHMKMEGVTIKVGEKFQLEPNVYAECPSMSGTARNDCRCRCFLEYRLMTVAEFAKATGQAEEAVRKKYNMQKSNEDEKRILNSEQTIDRAKSVGEELEKRFGDGTEKCTSEKIFEAVEKKAGNDGLPRVVTSEEFDELATGKTVIYRGYHADRGGMSVDEMIDEFKYGKLYCGNSGGAAYGRGTYFTPDKNIATGEYAYNGGKVITAIFDDTAKIADFGEISKEYLATGIPQTPYFKRETYQEVISDLGSYAALKGYDGIALNGFQDKQHIIMLNRTKLIIKE